MGRRRYTADFKRKVVVEAMRGDSTVREIAARHGINPNQLSRWKTEAYDGLLEVFGDGGGGTAARDTERLVERLYARIGELVVERLAFHGLTPQSRLEGSCALSGLAANSSITAASWASRRFCPRSMSRSSRQRSQRKSPSSLLRYEQRRHPPCATSAARLLRQLAALRSRQGWQLAYQPPSGLGARFRLHRGCEHSSGSSRRTACGTKPCGSLPLHWAMRV